MDYRLIIKPLAEEDIVGLCNWYDRKKNGLGDDLLSELERTVVLIQANPLQYQVRYKEVRMAKVRRFPICLHYDCRRNNFCPCRIEHLPKSAHLEGKKVAA